MIQQFLIIGFCLELLHLNYSFALHSDPYLNTDAGTISPFEHGEVFVLDDGGEVKEPSCVLLTMKTIFGDFYYIYFFVNISF